MKNPFIRDGYTGRMPLRICPFCSHELNGISNLTSKDQPNVGDFTVCIGCRSVLRFGEGMTLEKSSLMEVPVQSRFAFAKLIRVMEQSPPLPWQKR